MNGSAARIVKIPMEKEYYPLYRLKDYFARLISKIYKKDIILMFEKYSNKASESGWYVFTKLMETDKKYHKKVYFIIDKNSPDYEKAKNKYPKNVIDKYSFKHYLYIYISKYFMSSELSNHVINPRLYLHKLNRVITKKPLIFLQHGIMFAKPVDNPAAQGFYKGKTGINIFKNVISSDLEASQFYKMGYNDLDLIKCGLPKFDISYSNPEAKDILVMLTYRYWEEGLAENGEKLKQTTYYKAYIDIVQAFKENGLIENLKLAGHPKFMKALIEAMPEYNNIIVEDINEGLKNTKIFITDYSSASYDAHYRGSYIIYYWAQKDYLIENYQAIPPINEKNCDGIPVYSLNELINEVNVAIKKNYKMPAKYEKRYKKINEFSDNNNAMRLIEALKNENIL